MPSTGRPPAGPPQPTVPLAHDGTGDLDWIRRTLDRLGLEAGRRRALLDQLAAVRRRAADPRLYVTVVGETSSGKSTFINSIMRRRLLPSSSLATTRAILRVHGSAAQAELRFTTASGERISCPTAAFDRWAGAHVGLAPAAPLETAVAHVLRLTAGEVHDLEVGLPTAVLGDGVMLSDTPGFSVEDAGHRELALGALHTADLLVVVVPAVAAMSLTLVDFLTGPARAFLDRCAIALTKIDLVDPEERDDVARAVVRRLADAGVPDPVVLPCAPGPALRTHLSTGRVPPEFADVETRLCRLLADRRRRAVRTSVALLLRELLRAVAAEAEQGGERLRTAERELAGLALPDLDGFLGGWAARTTDRSEAEIRSAAAGYGTERVRSAVAEAVTDAVDAGDIRALTSTAERVAAAVVGRLTHAHEVTTTGMTSRLASVLDRARADLGDRFGEEFHALAALAGRPAQPPPAAPHRPIALGTLDVSDLHEALRSLGAGLATTAGWRTGGSAAAGAVLGTAVLPGLGTVIGAALGGVVGRPSQDALRRQFLTRAEPLVAQAVATTEESVTTARETVLAAARTWVDDLVAGYRDVWGPPVADLVDQQARRHEELRRRLSALDDVAGEARARAARLTEAGPSGGTVVLPHGTQTKEVPSA
ncbi:MAG TPA: dynamin family protein [Kineosporiaceae bacterium]